MLLSKILTGVSILAPTVTYAQNEPTNRALVEKYVSSLSNGDYGSLVSLFTSPNSTYWVSGLPARTAGVGNLTAAERIGGFPDLLGYYDKFSLTINSMAAEGDIVSIEAVARGQGPGTFLYLQTLVMVFQMTGGKIYSLREYIDPEEGLYLVTYRERYAQLQQGL